MLLPEGRQRVSKDSRVGNLEPLLLVDLRPIVMGRIHQLVRPREPHGELPGALQVPAPPVGVALVEIDALDDNQPIWIDGQDGIARTLGSQAPIGAGIATAPGRWPVRLVGQVRPDYGLIAPVVLGQHDPILDPARLGRLVGVPQWGPLIGHRIMTVQYDSQAKLTSTLDNPLQQCQPAQALEVRVQLIVDPLRLARRVEELIGERQANGIEACARDLFEHVLPVALLQPMRDESTTLKPRPVDAQETHLAARRIHQLAVKAPEETYQTIRLAAR